MLAGLCEYFGIVVLLMKRGKSWLVSRQCCHRLYKDLGSSCLWVSALPCPPSLPWLWGISTSQPLESWSDKNLEKARVGWSLWSGIYLCFSARKMCPISSALSCHNPSLWSAEFPSSLQPFPDSHGSFLALKVFLSPRRSLQIVFADSFCIKTVAFSPFSLFPLLGLSFKAWIRVCWGRTAGSAHCVPDLTQAALCPAAPVPERLELIKFIYRAHFALSASADAATSCPKSSSRIKWLFLFWGQWGFTSGYKFLIFGGALPMDRCAWL